MSVKFDPSKAHILIQAARSRKTDLKQMTQGLETGGSFVPSVARKFAQNPERFSEFTLKPSFEEKAKEFHALLGGKSKKSSA